MTHSKCPICGGDPEINTTTTQLRSYSTNSGARNVNLVKEIPFKHNPNRTIKVYEQTHYTVRCATKDCLLHSISKKFWTPDDAYAAWDTRKETN